MDQSAPSVQVKCRVTPAELERLDALAAATHYSRSQLLRLSVDRLLGAQEPPPPGVRVPVAPLPTSLLASAAPQTTEAVE